MNNKTIWDNIGQVVNSRQSVMMPGQKPGTSNTKGTFNQVKVSLNGSDVRTLYSTIRSKKDSTSSKNTRFIQTAGNLGFGNQIIHMPRTNPGSPNV